jgi:hypothetical protein
MPAARAFPAARAAAVAVPDARAERPDAPSPFRESPGSAVRLRVVPAAEELELAARCLEQDDPSARPDAVRRAQERLLAAIRADDLSNALTLASVLVYTDPDHAIARRIKDACAKVLSSAPTRPFPKPSAVPRKRMPWPELSRRSLSRAEAHVLWCIDGRLTVEEVVDASALPPLTAFETLEALLLGGVIDLG